VNDAIGDFWRDTKSRFDLMKGDAQPAHPAAVRAVPVRGAVPRIARQPCHRAHGARHAGHAATGAGALPELGIERKAADPLFRLRATCPS
jgi:transcription-repair coupling factor (superfamily II helicase)